MRLPTVLYSLITGRSNCGTPSGYGGSAPRPRPPGASGRVDDRTRSGDQLRRGARSDRPRAARRVRLLRRRGRQAPSSETPPAASTSAGVQVRETPASVLCRRRRPRGSRRRRSAVRRPRCCSPDRLRRARAARRCPSPGDRDRGSSGSSADRRPARAAGGGAAASGGLAGPQQAQDAGVVVRDDVDRAASSGSAAMPPKSTPPLLVGNVHRVGVADRREEALVPRREQRASERLGFVGRQIRTDVVDAERLPSQTAAGCVGIRLRRPALLAGHVGLRHRPFFDRPDRLAGHAVEHVEPRSSCWRRRPRRGCARCGGSSSAAARRWDRCPRGRDARTGSATGACRCARRARRSRCRTDCAPMRSAP